MNLRSHVDHLRDAATVAHRAVTVAVAPSKHGPFTPRVLTQRAMMTLGPRTHEGDAPRRIRLR